MFSFLKASPPAPRIESSRTDAEYKKLRWQVFAGVFIGYAAYYLIRKNFSLAIPYLIDEYGFMDKVVLLDAKGDSDDPYGYYARYLQALDAIQERTGFNIKHLE